MRGKRANGALAGNAPAGEWARWGVRAPVGEMAAGGGGYFTAFWWGLNTNGMESEMRTASDITTKGVVR
jgi:hypothetical protein